ncbi:DUF1905 domain-containing protein [Candidatus Saccharibacteria bacterium CG10_big_fil_rev_8_21_14_0_10_47_8]|nr:MAG: DUF1905 domain-containing protein [Candidatus Saccharibacteria bacterium CG10_big_fil_rev_8_21_14_0_10_47_8]
MELTFKAELWEWQGQGAWCFISLPKKYYEEIRLINAAPKRGFGSVRVEATIGKTAWRTSIFPDSKSRSYLLPVKKDVRKNEDLQIGNTTSVKVRLLEV